MQRQPRVHDSKLPGELKCPILHPPAPLPCRTATRPRHVRDTSAPRCVLPGHLRGLQVDLPRPQVGLPWLDGRRCRPRLHEIARDCTSAESEPGRQPGTGRQPGGGRQAAGRRQGVPPSPDGRRVLQEPGLHVQGARPPPLAGRGLAPSPPDRASRPCPPPSQECPLSCGVCEGVKCADGNATQCAIWSEARRSRETQPRDGAERRSRGTEPRVAGGATRESGSPRPDERGAALDAAAGAGRRASASTTRSR